jgi:fibronectin type 3 domain-containing protein
VIVVDPPGPRRLGLAILAGLAAVVLAAGGASAVSSGDTGEHLPDPLYGYGTATLGEAGYVVGGAHTNGTPTDAILEVEPDGSVRSVASLPLPLLEPGVAAVDGTVYVFGGAQEPGGGLPETTDAIHTYDPDSGETSELVTTTLPEDAASIAAVPLDGQVYLFGGLQIDESGGEGTLTWLDTVWRFDPEGPSVTELDVSLPQGRGQSAAAVVDGTVLLLGGMGPPPEGETCPNNATYCPSDDVLRFNPAQTSLGEIGTLPERVRWSSAAAYEGTVYLMGGCRASCGPYGATGAIVAVDGDSGEAEELPPSVPDRGGRHAPIVFDERVLLPGGLRTVEEQGEAHDRVRRVTMGATTPWAPDQLDAGPGSDGSVALDWEPPPYDGGSPVTEYEVHRAQGEETHQPIARTADTELVDEDVELGTTYTYRVRAVNQVGTSAPSATVGHQPTATPSAPPVSLEGGDAHVVVHWDAPDDAGGGNLTAYRVLAARSAEDLSGCETADCWDLSTASHRLEIEELNGTAVENDGTVHATAQARNEHGWGPTAEPVEATARPAPDPPEGLRIQDRDPRNATLNLTWDASLDADGYVVYRGPSVDALEKRGEAGTLRFTDTDVPRGQDLVYAVAGTDDGREGPTSTAVRTVFPTPPGEVRNLTARWTGGAVVVTWRTPADLGGASLEAYEVARTQGAVDPGQAEAEVQRVEDPSFRDEAPPRGQPSTYHVRAAAGGGDGNWSMTQIKVPGTTKGTPPDAVLHARPENPAQGELVFFDASDSEDESGVEAYRFDFGDGTSTDWRSEPRTSHAYQEPGVYTAELEVRDADGVVAEPTTVTLGVGEEPPDEEPSPPSTDDGAAGQDTPLAPALALVGLAGAALAARGRTR